MVQTFLSITPRPAERGRRTKHGGIMTPEQYRNYQNQLHKLLIQANLEQGDYVAMDAIYFVPYAKSTPEKKRINGKLNRQKPDEDNYRKALKDAISHCKILACEIGKGKNKKISHDDALLSGGSGIKLWINDPIGGIFFVLMTQEEYYERHGNPMDKFL